MQRLRDNPECADQEHRRNETTPIRAWNQVSSISTKMWQHRYCQLAWSELAVLREQGVNWHVEMAAASTCRLRCYRPCI
ncbi:hypothetical protein ACLB1E_14855 [Escherichia coli]